MPNIKLPLKVSETAILHISNLKTKKEV